MSCLSGTLRIVDKDVLDYVTDWMSKEGYISQIFRLWGKHHFFKESFRRSLMELISILSFDSSFTQILAQRIEEK